MENVTNILGWLTANWEKIVLVITTVWTIYQEFRHQVLKKQ